MKVKLSDFILENSVNESDIIDIEFESLRAKIDVCCEMANYYEKLLNTQMIQEAMPAQQPPTVPTAQDLQQPSSGYTQDIDTDMPAGYKSTQSDYQQNIPKQNIPSGLKTYLEKNKVIFGNYTASNGETYVITYEKSYDPNYDVIIQSYPISARPDASGKYSPFNSYIWQSGFDPNLLFEVQKHLTEHDIAVKNNDSATDKAEIQKAKALLNSAKQQETPQQQEQQQSQPQQTQQPQTQQQQPASALSGAIASMLVAVGLFAAKFLDYLKRHADTNLNLAHIKEAITASRKYIDLIYTMALNENFNDNDFNEFIKQFRDMMRIVENAASNAANNSAGQTFTQNARGLLNSEEVKSIESKIQQIQDARFQSQLQSRLSGLSPQNLQMLNSDAQKFKTDMTDLITSATNDIKSASYQQFKPAQQTQTSYQPQQQQATQAPNTQQQQGGQLAQMQ